LGGAFDPGADKGRQEAKKNERWGESNKWGGEGRRGEECTYSKADG